MYSTVLESMPPLLWKENVTKLIMVSADLNATSIQGLSTKPSQSINFSN